MTFRYCCPHSMLNRICFTSHQIGNRIGRNNICSRAFKLIPYIFKKAVFVNTIFNVIIVCYMIRGIFYQEITLFQDRILTHISSIIWSKKLAFKLNYICKLIGYSCLINILRWNCAKSTVLILKSIIPILRFIPGSRKSIVTDS